MQGDVLLIDYAGEIDGETARKAVGAILSFLYQQGDREKVVALVERIPGAENFVNRDDPDSSASLGGLGGLMGGGNPFG